TCEFNAPDVIVFGGRREAAADSLLERKAQMSILDTVCADVRRRRDAVLQKREEANAGLENATRELEEVRRHYESAEREQSAFDNRIPFLERDFEATQEKIEQFRSEEMTLAQQ